MCIDILLLFCYYFHVCQYLQYIEYSFIFLSLNFGKYILNANKCCTNLNTENSVPICTTKPV